MSTLQFISVESMQVTCPLCDGGAFSMLQDGDLVRFENVSFIGGDTLPHAYFGEGRRWTEYDAQLIAVSCPRCEGELYLVELCVTSNPGPNLGDQFIYDGFGVPEREQLYRVHQGDLSWTCVRQLNVNDRMGKRAKIHQRYDIHWWGPFSSDGAFSSGVMCCQPSSAAWGEAARILEHQGPVCLEHMRQWMQGAGDEKRYDIQRDLREA